MMHMTFYWGTKLTLLFNSWKTDSWLSYLLTLLACFFAASFYQFMEDRRLRFKSLASAKIGAPSISGNEAAPFLIKRGGVNAPKYATAVFFGINSAIGYLLMLAIMSYNGGVFLAVVLGLTIGYLFFRSGDEEIVVVDNPCACA